jgi:hypothetical protein
MAVVTALMTALAALATIPTPSAASAVSGGGPTPATAGLWHAAVGSHAQTHDGHVQAIHASHFRTFTLDRAGMIAALRAAPMEFTAAAGSQPLVLALPDPRAGFQSFAVQESPIMEPGLARLHPDVRTYDGRGIDDPAATVRIAMTPIGFTASVRGQSGSWYIDSYYHLDQSLYVTYFGADLRNTHGDFIESQVRSLDRSEPWMRGIGAGPALSSGKILKVYRLALLSDPSFAAFWGAGNVTSGKVTLMNRADQIYGDEFAYRMDLVAHTDRINLNTDAQAFGANGPCGTAPCFSQSQLSSCGGSTLSRNRIVLGQLIGADRYDIGHVAVGQNGGGVAQLAVVGGTHKAEGCTGIPEPDGDFYVVDYMTHEMGHEFGMNHPFNGNQSNCGFGNRNPATSYEPGSGSSIMAYAGICGSDDLQPHSDPYFSAISYQETQAYTSSKLAKLDEVQTASFYDFGAHDSFTVNYKGTDSATITNGDNYTVAGIQQAIEDILPKGGTVAVAAFGGSGSLSNAGFQVTFGGTLGDSPVDKLALTNTSPGFTGFVGVTTRGGVAPYNRGFKRIQTGNQPPSAVVPEGSFTIPYQTPFALTGKGTDQDGDTVTYLWEQFDSGDANGTGLVDNDKTNGPLFREFGTALDGDQYDPHAYGTTPCSNGENCANTDPTRVFPDLPQILANNTNAESGTCPAAGPPPVDLKIVDCYSEFLPTSVYAGPLHFILTTRDGNPNGGGVKESTMVTVKLGAGTGPFLVTSPDKGSFQGGSKLTVTWDVAGTAAAPINTASVDILLSTNGGKSFPITLASKVPNDGSAKATLPQKQTGKARIEVRAFGNVFFDVSDHNFSIT